MIFNHLWGLYAHPQEEWQTIDNRHESIFYSLSHIALVALIPSIMGYYSSVYLGWSVGTGEPVYLTHGSALLIGVAMYCALIVGVFILAYLATGWLLLSVPTLLIHKRWNCQHILQRPCLCQHLQHFIQSFGLWSLLVW